MVAKRSRRQRSPLTRGTPSSCSPTSSSCRKELSQIKANYEHALVTKLNPELTKKEPVKKEEKQVDGKKSKNLAKKMKAEATEANKEMKLNISNREI